MQLYFNTPQDVDFKDKSYVFAFTMGILPSGDDKWRAKTLKKDQYKLSDEPADVAVGNDLFLPLCQECDDSLEELRAIAHRHIDRLFDAQLEINEFADKKT